MNFLVVVNDQRSHFPKESWSQVGQLNSSGESRIAVVLTGVSITDLTVRVGEKFKCLK